MARKTARFRGEKKVARNGRTREAEQENFDSEENGTPQRRSNKEIDRTRRNEEKESFRQVGAEIE